MCKKRVGERGGRREWDRDEEERTPSSELKNTSWRTANTRVWGMMTESKGGVLNSRCEQWHEAEINNTVPSPRWEEMMEIFTLDELDSLILDKKYDNCEANWYKSTAVAAEQESADACIERLKKRRVEAWEGLFSAQHLSKKPAWT